MVVCEGEAAAGVGLRGFLQATLAFNSPHERFANLTARRRCRPISAQTLAEGRNWGLPMTS